MPVNFRKTTFWGLAAQLDQCPPADRPEIIMSGRSNVGKSSLINALADHRGLARVSQSPGKTRHIIYFDVDGQLRLTDLPGFGFARAARDEQARFSRLTDQYLNSSRPIVLVLHLLDIRHQPNTNDLQMMAWLTASGLPWQIILTKADKLSRAQQGRQKQAIARTLGLADVRQLLAVSVQTRQGIEALRSMIAQAAGVDSVPSPESKNDASSSSI